MMGGFCPGGFVQGDFVRGDFVLGGILSRGILSGGFCPGGFCPGGFCPRTEFATLPTTPLDFQGKISYFCHLTLLKIRSKITATLPPLSKWAKSKLQHFNKL